MLNLTAINVKRQWRMPILGVFAAGMFLAAFLASSTLSRVAPASVSNVSPRAGADVVAGGVSATDRQISALQDHLRQAPSDQKSATQLGLAYLQRARETSDPSYLTRADGILNQALTQAPADADTLIGLGTLALARHQCPDAVSRARRTIPATDYTPPAYDV